MRVQKNRILSLVKRNSGIMDTLLYFDRTNEVAEQRAMAADRRDAGDDDEMTMKTQQSSIGAHGQRALRNVGDQYLVAAAIVFAIAADVASLAAHVARLDRVRAVARDVARFVAVVARHVLSALRL